MKGSGRTPFSRGGDGRSALSNSVREFLCGAALEARQIPASHSPALLSGTSFIFRDAFYDGYGGYIPAGVLFRTAPTFLRFGSVQLAQQRLGRNSIFDMLHITGQSILDMERKGLSRPAIFAKHPSTEYQAVKIDSATDDSVLTFARDNFSEGDCFFISREDSCLEDVDWKNFRPTLSFIQSEQGQRDLSCVLLKIVHRFAGLAAAWRSVGFVHGVLNTDNMSLIGITIDLNVFGWITNFDDNWTSNFIDNSKRYSLGNQTERVRENLERLFEAFAESS